MFKGLLQLFHGDSLARLAMDRPPEMMTEAEVRALRDRVFGTPTTDKNWDYCKTSWMRLESIWWLKVHDK
jgi:hypothetical protein